MHGKEIFMRTQQRFQKSDLFALLAYPLYQVIGTVRHEASHALVALNAPSAADSDPLVL